MNSHLVYGYAAFLFGFGLMEVATVAVQDVLSLECASYSEGPGILAHYDKINDYFIFIEKKYGVFEQLRKKLMDPSADDSPFVRFDVIATTNAMAEENIHGTVEDHVKVYPLKAIEYYSCSDSSSLTIRYKNDDVKIQFSNKTGCKDFAKLLSAKPTAP